eukprot:156583_1
MAAGRARALRVHYSSKMPSKKKHSTFPFIYDLRWFTFGVDFCLFIVGTFYAILVPFTKSEESFNMQASHDMLFHGYTNLQNYAHHQSPDLHAVPHTFIGPFFLSLMVQPFKRLTQSIFPLVFSSFNVKRYCSDLIRISLLSINIMSLSYFRTSFITMYMTPPPNSKTPYKKRDVVTRMELIKSFSNLFAILITSQFHYMFYQSRVLSNCFALPCVTIAFGLYFSNKYHLAIRWLTVSTILFRWDTIIIAFPFITIMVLRTYWQNKALIPLISSGVSTAIVCIVLSLCIDSWFWNGFQSFTWPEWDVFRPNTSSNTHLMQVMLVNIVFIPCALFKINPLLSTDCVVSVHLYMQNIIQLLKDCACKHGSETVEITKTNGTMSRTTRFGNVSTLNRYKLHGLA